MIIQHNIAALNSHRNLGVNNTATNKNLEKLSSGFRINRAGDDAAGLAISEKMRGQIRGLAMAEQNAANGISLIQTAEGGLNETHAILQRMRELAVQASNGTYQNDDRLQIQHEIDALVSEIDRISTSTHYNGIELLNGNLSDKVRADMANIADAGGIVSRVNLGTNANDGESYAINNVSYTAAAAATSATKTMGGFALTFAGGNTTVGGAGTIAFTVNGATVNVSITATMEEGDVRQEVLNTLNGALTDSVASFNSTGDLVLTSKATDVATFTDTVALAAGNTISNLTYTALGAATTVAGDPAVAEALTLDIIDGANTTHNFDLDTDGSVRGSQWTVTDALGNEYTINLDAFRRAEAATPGSANALTAAFDAIEGENLVFQIGANGTADQQVDLEIRDMGAGALGVANLNLRTRVDANAAIDLVDAATNLVSTQRAQLGALQNRLEHTLNNLGVTKENLTAAESTIRDVDMAKEMMEFTKNSILVQASQAMLAQANSLPQGVLSLLR